MDFFCPKEAGLWASISCHAMNWIPFVVFIVTVSTCILPALKRRTFLFNDSEDHLNLAFRVYLLQQIIVLPGIWLFGFALRLTEIRGSWDEASDGCNNLKASSLWKSDFFQVYATGNIIIFSVWCIYELLSAHGGNSPSRQDILAKMDQVLNTSNKIDAKLAEFELGVPDDSSRPDSPEDYSPSVWSEAAATTNEEIRPSRQSSTCSSFEWVPSPPPAENPTTTTSSSSSSAQSSSPTLEKTGLESKQTPSAIHRTCASETGSIRDAAFAGIGEPYKVLSDEIFHLRRELVRGVFERWEVRGRDDDDVREMTLGEVVRHAMVEGDVFGNMGMGREEFEDRVIDWLQVYAV
ncbi:MAG: hypothetical protein M1835_002535 [Candelina submexicana]|nr:MAG: hypothetical protein M1835_002535 [Candelina submexicana]